MKSSFKIYALILLIGMISLQGCAVYNSLTNTFDDAELSEADSATIITQEYLSVFAYKKHGRGSAEDPIGNLRWKSKVPAGFYRLEVSIDKPGLGKSFVPVSLLLNARKGKKYWVAYDDSHGFFMNSWKAAVLEGEPSNFYGLLEFWKDKD